MNERLKNIVIIDYGLSNLFSVKHACSHFGFNATIVSDRNRLENADAIILPGVGAFGKAMENLNQLDMVEPLKDFVASGKPLLGICLGLQLLFEESEEFGNHKGLGFIKGVIKKFPKENKNGELLKVPYIGWNQIYRSVNNWKNTPLKDLMNREYMYFVHSYYAFPENKEDILSLAKYGNIEFCSSIKRDNILATQFHPEKSADSGLSIYKNWFNNI